MERETIDVSDSDEEEEVIPIKNPKVSETKLWIENEKLSTKSKIDELRSKVMNLRKRQKGNDEHESDTQSQDEASPAKKSRQTECSDSTSESDIVIIEDFNGSSGSKQTSLPSFKPMAEVDFLSVIKVSKPSLLELKYTDDSNTSSETTRSEVNSNKRSNNDGTTSKKDKARISEVDIVPTKGRRNDSTGLHEKPQISPSQSRESSREPPRERDEPQPLVKVIFRDEELARMFRKAVHEALVEVLAVEDQEIDESETFPGVELNIWESEIPEESQNLGELGSLFKLDTSPVKATLKRQIPKYKQAFNSVLEGKTKEEEEKKPEGAGSSVPNTCFNCEGNHMISECTIPINNEAVFKNRQKHNSMRRFQPKTSRYHIDEEQRFAHLVPGKVSDNLRDALGLKPNQLPRYVYRMRILGYPPGWLEEAKITHSGIALIDESKTGTNGSDSNTDLGASRDTYDISKLIEYPGFNISLPTDSNIIDETRRHQCPPLKWNQSKECMIEEIGSSAAKGYKKKKLKRDSMPNDDVIITQDDMETVQIDDEEFRVLDSTADSELQDEVQQATKDDDSISPPGVDTSILSQDSCSMPPSPSLATLMAQKQSILCELEGSGSKSQPATPGSPKCVSSSSNSVACTPEPTLGRTKSLSMGTPVLESHSPFSSLPCADKFSLGISDHLNFENLPDATGKFEKMKTIINKVRNIVDKLHDDDAGS